MHQPQNAQPQLHFTAKHLLQMNQTPIKCVEPDAPVEIQNSTAAVTPMTLEGEDLLADVEAVAVYALLVGALYTHQLAAHLFDFGLEVGFCFFVRFELHYVIASLPKNCKSSVVNRG